MTTGTSSRRDLPTHLWSRHWAGICLTVLIMAAETKFVLKDQVSGKGTNFDVFVAGELAVFLLVAIYVASRKMAPPTLRGSHWLEGALVAYVSMMVLSVPFSASPVYSAVRALEMAIVLVTIRAAIAEGAGRWFVSFAKCFLVGTTMLIVVGLTLPHQRGPLQVDRFNWLATHPATVGNFLALAASTAFVLAAHMQWRTAAPLRAAVYWIATGVFVIALNANHTRGSAGAAAAGILLGLALVLPGRFRPSALLVLAWVSVLVWMYGLPALATWVERGEETQDLASFNARTPLWHLALRTTLSENPLFGFGLGASRSIFVDETGLGGGHNAVINVLVDFGLVGLALWTFLIVASTWIVWRWPLSPARPDRVLWLSAMLTLSVNGMTTDGFGGCANVAAIWLMVLVGRAAEAGSGERSAARHAGTPESTSAPSSQEKVSK